MPFRLSVALLSTLFVACGSDPSTANSGADAGPDVPAGPIRVEPLEREELGCTACAGECAEQRLVYASRTHRAEELVYVDTPPVAGDHDRCWGTWGIYEEPLPPRNWVHNLEHGGIVVAYWCPDGCAEEVAMLAEWVSSLGDGAILTPAVEAMPRRFAVLAWEHRLLTDCVDMDAFSDFHARRADQAPESTTAMPPGSCM